MSTSVASDLDTRRASRGGGAGKIAIFAAKLLVTGGVLLVSLAADQFGSGHIGPSVAGFSLGRIRRAGGDASVVILTLVSHWRLY